MKKGFVCILLLCWVPAVSFANQYDKFIGDINDKSNSLSVHLLPLLDERGQKIIIGQNPVLPFSTKMTCGDCHNYSTISKGWHFNAVDPNVEPGRSGHPWIFVDAETATQIPLSYRGWPGTYRPQDFGLTYEVFTQLFARQMPGGGPGEVQTENPDEIIHRLVTGKLEVNCLACHSNHPGQNQAEFADQTNRLNFRWAATGACEFASVSGIAAKLPGGYDYLEPNLMPEAKLDAPTVEYNKSAFDSKNRVLFDIVKEVPNNRCYYCHSTKILSDSATLPDQDVHLAAGLKCIDCHRNKLDHQITRGYENEFALTGNPFAVNTSCKSCHLGDDTMSIPVEGRLGAPVPKHQGIPAVHFDKLTCTACHSGPWPEKGNYRIKTSIAHALGTSNIDSNESALPHIISPVFARGTDGKIGPFNLIWPAFWACLQDGKITPIKINIVKKTVTVVIAKSMVAENSWPRLTQEQIKEALDALTLREEIAGKPAYICGGRIFLLDENGNLTFDENEYASPYMWPIAHDVRPAAQALGVRKCQDCHLKTAAFNFGVVQVDSPLVTDQNSIKVMVEFQDLDSLYMKWFAFSFVFRPWLKITALICSLIIAAILLLYGLKVLNLLTKVFANKEK